ncbi:MAG: Hpt domain protein, partial [Gemmatimonadetes bacterium]|nr:Hpt domain protein [Gemmatimonadota bacterium]
MTSPDGLLHFFVLEATDYIDRLDSLVTSAGEEGPDASAFGRYARNLRGSATMSRQMGIAELSSALERLARAIRNRAIKWDAALSGVVVAAVDDLRILVRAIRTPGSDESARVRARVEELGKLVPVSVSAFATPAQSQPSGATTFLASEAAELARALDHLVSAPDDAAARAHPAERVRAVRGVAELKDIPALGEVVEAVENTLKTLELSAVQAPTTKQKTLLTASAAILRRIARDIASRGRASDEIPELASFKAALAAAEPEAGRGDRIVPIAQLFHDDEGPHILTTAPQPPTSAAERFRLEVVSLAEHLRGVVAQARANRAPEQREKNQRELRSALRALGSAANSFGEKQVARFSAEWSVRVATLNDAQMEALDRAAAMLANPATRPEEVARGLERLAAPRAPQPGLRGAPTPTPLGDADVAAILRTPTPMSAIPVTRAAEPAPRATAPAAAAPPPVPDTPRQPTTRTPTGRQLRDYLQNGIAGFGALESTPLSSPAVIPDEAIVPIETLLYRGKAALARARELKSEMLSERTPPRETIEELFDLLDLAIAD